MKQKSSFISLSIGLRDLKLNTNQNTDDICHRVNENGTYYNTMTKVSRLYLGKGIEDVMIKGYVF